MFAILELKTMPLDSGTPGISPILMLLLFWMMLAISMIPYAFLYHSLRDNQHRAPVSLRLLLTGTLFGKMTAWLHAHRHPALLHH